MNIHTNNQSLKPQKSLFSLSKQPRLRNELWNYPSKLMFPQGDMVSNLSDSCKGIRNVIFKQEYSRLRMLIIYTFPKGDVSIGNETNHAQKNAIE